MIGKTILHYGIKWRRNGRDSSRKESHSIATGLSCSLTLTQSRPARENRVAQACLLGQKFL